MIDFLVSQLVGGNKIGRPLRCSELALALTPLFLAVAYLPSFPSFLPQHESLSFSVEYAVVVALDGALLTLYSSSFFFSVLGKACIMYRLGLFRGKDSVGLNGNRIDSSVSICTGRWYLSVVGFFIAAW